MPNKMLIDASHPEETRVVVVRGNRIEEFDFESQDKKQLKGNIYLARVTRVEPSLQAAFVEYGGNRHGFLAFSEIHPDYYQIPIADRQALLRAEAEDHEDEDDEDGDEGQDRGGHGKRRRRGRNRGRGDDRRHAGASASEEGSSAESTDGDENGASGDGQVATAEDDGRDLAELSPLPSLDEGAADESAGDPAPEAPADVAESENASDEEGNNPGGGSMAASVKGDTVSEDVAEAPEASEDRGTVEEVSGSHAEDHEIESVGAEDALEEVRNRRKPVRRHYKIQEVIKRRQILLVQVVKEERGNKGAALTTYLSLAGRYSVLMPNTARGGGISRKITNAQDRKRLKEVVQDLDVPQGMGVILRTAGESRTKAEIKRDYEYLMRMWETVRNTTLQSTAPALVYEEGSLIKRSVRDLYNKDIDEILVAGEEGYREAKDFMRMLMPSHAKVVQPFRDTSPIFARNGIEAQLDKMLQPQVTLRSGGYIIINQTEALVSIDVNSGRSTREHSIEDTALQTNLEAAEEVARQLRLRDLAGLIVIDFIDMEENRNNRTVEKRMKDCLKNDRARIQVGRISHFGLLEMSRQRIRASVLESTMKPCPHCGGTGHVRSDSSVALMVIRAIEEFLLKDSRHHITVRTPVATALYVLNHKRSVLVDLEARFGVKITMEADETIGTQHYAIFRGAVAEKPLNAPEAGAMQQPAYAEPDDLDDDIVEPEDAPEPTQASREQRPQGGGQNGGEEGDGRGGKRRRRRRRRGGRDRDHRDGEHRDGEQPPESAHAATANESDDDEADENGDDNVAGEEAEAIAAESGDDRKKRRRGKRGGKRNRRDGEEDAGEVAAEGSEAPALNGSAETAALVAAQTEAEPAESVADAVAEEAPAAPAPKPKRASRAKKVKEVAQESAAEAITLTPDAISEPVAAEPAPEPEAPVTEEPPRPSRRRAESTAPAEPVVSSSTATAEEQKPKKGGWWQRKGFF